MNRSEWLWVALRVLGLFFLAKGLITLPTIPVGIVLLRSVESLPDQIHEDGDEGHLSSALAENMTASLITHIMEFALYSLLSIYLCRRGRWLHAFMMGGSERRSETEGLEHNQ